jgi:hypothetical protein
MSIDSEQTPACRPAQPIAASAITPAIRVRIYRLASACRRSRLFWRKWEAWALPVLTDPITWTLIALIVSGIGLYWDLR